MTRLQTLALDAVASSVDSPFSSALAVDEMATLAVLPFALSGQDALMGDSCVMKRAKRLYVDEPGLCQRMEAVAAAKPVRGRTAVAPTFEALGCAAAERLGALLSSSDDLAQQCLVDSSDGGAWLSSVVALGVHLVLRDSPWFVSAVPSAMQRLPAGPSLDAAWMAVGSVVDLALQAESASCESKRRMLDAVAESSVNSSEGSPRNYWELLLGAMERCALSGGKGELAGAGLGWLERLMAIGCVVPEWVACSAALRLVHCVRVIVDSYVADRALLTLGPLPLHRSQLLRRVVEGLADLQCRPKALNGKSNAAQHIVLVFDCLVGLVSEGATRDAALVRALQKCFQRVAKQVLC
ncbi:hypothetical protein GGI20_004999 [Coemansia sp. BCRC 34301]|nr:hypothetical protein GGI20_004999 [Coemansia sp. BCRC 34301]